MGRMQSARSIAQAALAIAVTLAAYLAFRLWGRATPLNPEVLKLVLWTIVPLAAAAIAMRGDPGAALRAVGFRAPVLRALLPGLFAMVAAGGTLLVLGAKLPPSLSVASLAMTALLGPFAEEFLFRGYLVNRLLAAGVGALPAIVLSGLLFGAAHLGNVWHASLAEIALEVGITGAGGVLFGWALWRFGGSLWAAFAFHAGLNLPWDAFGVASTAIGDANGNIARAAGIAAGIAAVLLFSRRPNATSR
jgi:membrane protease YdiL (CAAX protease family)